MKIIHAQTILETLLSLKPRPTAAAPKTSRGIYGLVDHFGDLRYIGSTSCREQTFYERIHQRHRTGSEGMSHYFSFMYNVGRMWRDRKDTGTSADGHHAKALRNAFVAQHCAAVWVELPDDCDIAGIEREILSLPPHSATMWNGRKATPYEEPVELVDATMAMLGWTAGAGNRRTATPALSSHIRSRDVPDPGSEDRRIPSGTLPLRRA